MSKKSRSDTAGIAGGSAPNPPDEGRGDTLARIIGERRAKAANLREAGRNPYSNDFRPTHTIAEIRERYEATNRESGVIDGETIRVAGRVMARRAAGKKLVFAPIRDGSAEVQLFLKFEEVDDSDWEQVVPQLDVGDIVGAEGPMMWTNKGELSVRVVRFQIITKSLRPMPDKHGGLTDVEIRYRQRYLDLAVNPEVRDVFRKRSQIVTAIRRFLDDRDFLEVETPMMHPIIGGAAARPFTTHHNALDMDLFLRIAPELYLKRLVVGGFERVYEINRNFRNEGLSRQHNPEFTMLEFYQAYVTYEDHMNLTEELITGLATEVNGQTTVTWDGSEIDLAPGWRRLTVEQAVTELGNHPGEIFDDPIAAAELAVSVGVAPAQVAMVLLEGLGEEAAGEIDARAAMADFATAARRPEIAAGIVERYADEVSRRTQAGHLGYLIFDETVEHLLVQPTFLTQFPLAVSPLARKNESDPAYCDRFELFVAGREIANAFSELNDPDDQRARFLAQVRARAVGAEETMDYDEDYCRALELGMPSAAGEGIGIDRLTMLLCGQPSIRDVILFPLLKREDHGDDHISAEASEA